jgi:DNA-binding response OmpR family regulator
MPKRILSVSYDVSLLATRQMMLEQQEYEVISILGFTAALDACKTNHFDLFILGHSIPVRDKAALIQAFRENCDSPILSLERLGEERVPSDFHVSPDHPEELLRKVESILKMVDISQQSFPQTSQARMN